MQRDELKDILHQHASGFEIKPVSASFEKVMQKRAAVRNRRRVWAWGMAASFIAVSAVVLLLQSPEKPSMQLADRKTTVQQQQPYISTENDNASSVAASKGKSDRYDVTSGMKEPVSTPEPVRDNLDKGRAIQSQQAEDAGRLLLVSDTQNAFSAPNPESVVEHTEPLVASGTRNHNRSEATANNAVPSQTTTDISEKALPKNTTDSKINTADADGITGDTGVLPSKNAEAPVVITETPALKEGIAHATVIEPIHDSLMPGTALNVPDSVKPLPMVLNSEYPVKWRLTALFTPQFFNSVYNANSDASLSWMKQYLKNREQNDKALYSFNAGLKMERALGKHFSVSAGLLYSIVKFEEIRTVTTVVIDSSNKNHGVGAGLSTQEDLLTKTVDRNSFDISFNSLEVPIQFAYTFRHHKMYYQATAGMSYSYLFKTRSLVFDVNDSLNVKETNDAKNDRLRQHNLLLLGGINVGYQMTRHWGLYAGPVLRYSLNSIYSKDYIIRQRPYYIGAEMGVTYSF